MSISDIRKVSTVLLASSIPLLAGAVSLRVEPLATWPIDGVALMARPVGRVQPVTGERGWLYQWPGTYFEARFASATLYVDLGSGAKHARVSIDGREVADIILPDLRLLCIDGLPAGVHQVRVDIVSESRDGVQRFGGFAVPERADALKPPSRARAIEFIGDSYTVGYAAGSGGRDCSDDEVWRTTDNSLAFGPQVARRFDADYRVQAISGRGMVRNFGNAAGDTLPAAYARLLPDGPKSDLAPDDPTWSPQLIVIGLGTNDFSMPVGTGEPWKDAAALSTAFEARYIDFVRSLRHGHPSARFILLATDAGEGAAERAVRRVRARLVEEGVPVGDVLMLGPLALDACHWHPSRADQRAIARQLIAAIDALMPDWRQPPVPSLPVWPQPP